MLGHSGSNTGIGLMKFGGDREGKGKGKGYLDLVLGDVFGGAGGEEKVVVFCWLEGRRGLRELRRMVL